MTAIPIISSNNTDGNGFIIGHYFITAGHVIAECEHPRIRIDGRTIDLTDPLVCENSQDPSGLDLAIFDVGRTCGELELNEGDVTEGTCLQNHRYRTVAAGIELVDGEVTVNDYREGNYFGGLGDSSLKEGSSGSPVLTGNKVAGMVCGGNNDGTGNPVNPDLPVNFCVFLSSRAIRKALDSVRR